MIGENNEEGMICVTRWCYAEYDLVVEGAVEKETVHV
jgi:hypothetical protein